MFYLWKKARRWQNDIAQWFGQVKRRCRTTHYKRYPEALLAKFANCANYYKRQKEESPRLHQMLKSRPYKKSSLTPPV